MSRAALLPLAATACLLGASMSLARPSKPLTIAAQGKDNWRVRLAMAQLWVEAVNRHGGDATLVHLPAVGITGNTHFMFSDLNNVEIADQVSAFLADKKLD